MKIAIYGRGFDPGFTEPIRGMFDKLNAMGAGYYIHRGFLDFLEKTGGLPLQPAGSFSGKEDLDNGFDFLFSIGGDGTFLEAVTFISHLRVPVIGINSGRLGFLANISRSEIPDALEALFSRKFVYEERTLLAIETERKLFGGMNFALNELTIQKKGSSMITIQTRLNGEFLNAYWADGLIISTPTGSTAYSMSAGGPIMLPDCNNFIISPIAPHNLTVRPLVIRDDAEILLRVVGREDSYLLSADYRSVELPMGTELRVYRAGFTIRMVRFHNQNFYNTLRNKLMWGVDKRN